MRVLFTGQVGLDKVAYLNRVREQAEARGVDLQYATLGEKMIDSYVGRIDDRTILNLPKTLLDLLRRHAWDKILVEANGLGEDVIFVLNSHAVFRWHHGLFPALDLDLVRDFNPDVLVTLIDDVDRVKERLQERDTPFFELWELLAWREEEVWLTRFLRDSLEKLRETAIGFYVIPRDQGSELFFRLVSEPSTPKVYLSFAATGLPEEQRKEIEEFKAQVGARFIAFDPLALRERAVITTAQSLAKEIDGVLRPTLSNLVDQPREEDLRWKLMPLDERRALSLTEVRVGDTALDGSQVGAILQAVDSQIISRDYLLIDQSDLVVMYIRMGPDGPLISAGSQSEMIYAYSLGKPVYVVCAGGRAALSPWVTQFSEVFETLPQALEFLTQSYPNAGVQAEEGGG